MFFIIENTYFTGYLDNDTPFLVTDNTKDVILTLEEIAEPLIK